MTDHAFFIRIGDFAFFQSGHIIKCLVYQGFVLFKEILRKIHPADVQAQAQLRIFCVVFLESFPEFLLIV